MYAYARIEKPAPLKLPFPDNWLEGMAKLVRVLNRPEYPTVDALLSDLVGNDVAGVVMLRRLLIWHAKLGRAFYMSETDWWQQDRLKRGVIQRVKKLLPLAGWKVEVRKAEGVPQTHYVLNPYRLMARLGKLLKMPGVFLVSMMAGGNGKSRIEQMEMRESSRSLTKESSKESSKQSVVDLLTAQGMSVDQAQAFEALPVEVIQECIQSAQGRKVRNRVGYLIGALRKQRDQREAAAKLLDDMPPLAAPAAQSNDVPPLAPPAAQGEDQAGCDKQVSDNPLGWRFGAVDAPPSSSPRCAGDTAPPSSSPRCAGGGQYSATEAERTAWEVAYDQLALRLDRASFDTWLRGASFAGVDEGVFVVRVRNLYAAEMLQYRLYRPVQAALRDVMARGFDDPPEIRFEVE